MQCSYKLRYINKILDYIEIWQTWAEFSQTTLTHTAICSQYFRDLSKNVEPKKSLAHSPSFTEQRYGDPMSAIQNIGETWKCPVLQ